MATRPRYSYSTPGSYRTGIWLIVSPSGQAALADRNRLPPVGQGYKYYWLGATQQQANSRVLTALTKVDPNLAGSRIQAGQEGFSRPVSRAFKTGFSPIGSPSGLGNWISSNWPFLIPLIGAGDTGIAPDAQAPDAGGDTTGGGRARAGGDSSGDSGGNVSGKAAAGLAGATAIAITDPLDFLKFIAWLFHPRNILRMVEFLTGIVMMAFGFHAAMQSRGESAEGFATSEGALSRSGLGRVARELAASSRREGGGRSGRRPQRPAPAPHTTRRKALRLRYERERQVAGRREKQRRKAS